METSSLSAPPGLSRVLSLLTKALLARNPPKATKLYAVFLNFPRMNGRPSQATFVLLVTTSVLGSPHSRFIHPEYVSCYVRDCQPLTLTFLQLELGLEDQLKWELVRVGDE